MSSSSQNNISANSYPRELKFPLGPLPRSPKNPKRKQRTRNSSSKASYESPQQDLSASTSAQFDEKILYKIWNYAVPKNNNVVIVAYIGNHNEGRYRFKSPNMASPLLGVCKTSRLVALTHYNASIGSRGSKRKIRFDGVNDKVLLQVEGNNQFIDQLVDSVSEEKGFGAIQTLIVKEDFAQQLHWKEDLIALFRTFRGLRTLGMAVPGNFAMVNETAGEEDDGRAFAIAMTWGRVRSGLMNTSVRRKDLEDLRDVLRDVYPLASRPMLELVRIWPIETLSAVEQENTGVGVGAGVGVGEAGEEGGLSDEIMDNLRDYELQYGIGEEENSGHMWENEKRAAMTNKRSKSL